jgi:hypothetical protein
MPGDLNGWLTVIGALCFGIVMGWVTYRTLRRTQPSGLTDIATVIGAVAGAAITAIWKPGTSAFGAYCVGLLLGFFGYLTVAVEKGATAPDWMGSEAPPSGGGGGGNIRPPPTV